MKKLNWGHGLLIALGCFMIFILTLILVFPLGKQNAELISDNYYEEELVYQEVIDAKNNAEALTVTPIYKQSAEGIRITFPEELTVDENKINFFLFRTDDSNLDVKKDLILENRSILIPNKILAPGSYTLKIKWYGDKKPHQIDYDVIWK